MKLNLSEMKAYYINLPEHTDRNQEFLKMITGLGYQNITRIDGQRMSTLPHGGLAKATYEFFSNVDDLPFILFEDDARPINYKDTIEFPDDADAIYLGMIIYYDPVRTEAVDGYPDVRRVFNPLGRHAVIYKSKEYMNAVKELAYRVYTQTGPEEMRILDWAVHSLMNDFKVYAVTPRFYQHNDRLPRMSNLSRIINLETLEIDPIAYNYVDRYTENE